MSDRTASARPSEEIIRAGRFSSGEPPTGARRRAARGADVEETPRSVLVIEDYDDSREILVEAFRGVGLPVLEAASAEAARCLIRDNPSIGLVVTDYTLGDGDGVSLLNEAWDQGFLDGAPAMIVTAHPSVPAPKGVMVLRKPVDPLVVLAHGQELMRASERAPGSRDA